MPQEQFGSGTLSNSDPSTIRLRYCQQCSHTWRHNAWGLRVKRSDKLTSDELPNFESEVRVRGQADLPDPRERDPWHGINVKQQRCAIYTYLVMLR